MGPPKDTNEPISQDGGKICKSGFKGGKNGAQAVKSKEKSVRNNP